MKRVLPGFPGLAALAIAAGLATLGCQQQGSLVGVLATGEVGVTSIAVDDFYVYWTTQDGEIRKVPSQGGAVQSVATAQSGADNLVVDETHLVWSTGDSINALVKTTGVVNSFVANGTVQRLSTDPTSVYWTVASGDVNAASKTGAQSRALATAQVNPLAISAGAMIYWADAGATGQPSGGGAVLSVGPSGGTAQTVLPMQDNPVALMTDGAYLYWGNQGDSTNGTVSIAAVDGTNPQTLASNVAQLHTVVGDGVSVYYSSLDGSVSAVPVSGAAWMTTNQTTVDMAPGTTSTQSGTPLILGPAGTVSLAMDATSIYWANQADLDGAILTMPKL